jgi:hypothetical protein
MVIRVKKGVSGPTGWLIFASTQEVIVSSDATGEMSDGMVSSSVGRTGLVYIH